MKRSGRARKLEKRIRVSTHGRLTIPKAIRDVMKIEDGQPVIIRSVQDKREIVIELMVTISEYTG